MFEIGTVLSKGFEGFKANIGPFIVAMIIAIGISIGFNVLQQVTVGVLIRQSQAVALIAMFGIMFVQQVIMAALTLGAMNMALKVARGKSAEIGDLFAIGSFAVPGLLTYILVNIAVFVGMIFFIIPGVIIGLGTSMALWFVIDKQLDPITAIKASWSATTGSKGQIFVFGLAAFCLMIVGLIPCGLGLFVVYPTVGIAMAHIYCQLSGYAKLEG